MAYAGVSLLAVDDFRVHVHGIVAKDLLDLLRRDFVAAMCARLLLSQSKTNPSATNTSIHTLYVSAGSVEVVGGDGLFGDMQRHYARGLD